MRSENSWNGQMPNVAAYLQIALACKAGGKREMHVLI